MKKIGFLIIIALFYSCGKEKVIQLPEIQHAAISKIEDVSAAYLFFDETKIDRVDLNRKNIISSTNWLINVDKRLTLKQVIPHITFLQDKKNNSSHKKETNKNYFTCNDTSKKNLGFIEFTNVVYHDGSSRDFLSKTSNTSKEKQLSITFFSLENIEINEFPETAFVKKSTKINLKNDLQIVVNQLNKRCAITLNFNKNLTFQEYISIKSLFLNSDLKSVSISNHEFIFN